MGTSFKKAIFEEHIQEGLVGWARAAKKGGCSNGSTAHGSTAPGSSAHDSSHMSHKDTTPLTVQNLQMTEVGEVESDMEEGREITTATDTHVHKRTAP
ncbi:MLO-like protein 1 [Morella rubra]|uniref:MLO-like protein 1 n=1 Tax=Morella rubra TaxID=262757 RepID=A0A6A1VZ08_9ROSI|nr:MLO-like protein 1 [Morella rubra]